jgi:DNA-binding PadR family transcriptional regulator
MTRTLNATSASLLGFLHEGPMTGWDLVATAQQRIGDFWSLTQSQVYRELTAMAEAGLVEAGDPGPRARRPYALTDAGREAFGKWLEDDVTEELIRSPLLLVVMFGRHVPPDRLAEVIASHRRLHTQRLALYEKQLDEPPTGEPDPYAAATLDYGVRYERAVMSWFDALPEVIRGKNG